MKIGDRVVVEWVDPTAVNDWQEEGDEVDIDIHETVGTIINIHEEGRATIYYIAGTRTVRGDDAKSEIVMIPDGCILRAYRWNFDCNALLDLEER